MNCKPGDLAVIVGAKTLENNGLIVHVLHAWVGPGRLGRHNFTGDEPAWVVFSTGRPIVTYKAGLAFSHHERPLADAILRPIRDPGDDAVDESKAWLPPVPTKTREAA